MDRWLDRVHTTIKVSIPHIIAMLGTLPRRETRGYLRRVASRRVAAFVPFALPSLVAALGWISSRLFSYLRLLSFALSATFLTLQLLPFFRHCMLGLNDLPPGLFGTPFRLGERNSFRVKFLIGFM